MENRLDLMDRKNSSRGNRYLYFVQKIVYSLALLFLFTPLLAQETCLEKLYYANILYEKGQIEEAIEIANKCLSESNSKRDQWQACRLLAMAYMASNQQIKARKAAEQMLSLNPTYKPSELKDPAELRQLLKMVKVIPKFSMGLAATVGGSVTFNNIKATYNGADYTKSYSSKSNWLAGMVLGYNINERLSLNTGLIVVSKNFDIQYKLSATSVQSWEPDWEVKIEEKLTYVDLPVFARITTKPKGKYRFFADAGGFAGRLINSQSNFDRNSILDSYRDDKSENLSSELRRNKWEYGLLIGGGVLYSLKKLNLALNLNYYHSFSNVTQAENRYKNESLFYNYFYIDDDFSLSNLSISLSFIYNLNYKVIKSK